MCFKDIYNKVEELKDYSIEGILAELGVDVIYTCSIPLNKTGVYINTDNPTILIRNDLSKQDERNVLLHEIGHSLFDYGCHISNHRKEENNANLFMCLYLINNNIWEAEYFDHYLIYKGVEPKIARQFNDRVWQYKHQVKFDMVY